jgi:ribonuclease P protein subunit POP4
MISIDNISRHEFIGLKTRISDSSNPQVIGLNGTIINETKSMFTINTKKGIKHIPKSTSNWKFSISGQNTIVNGSKIAKRPFERIGVKA